jgi:Transport and Golgi organisation 2
MRYSTAMCTLTIFPTGKFGHIITMNRDELRTRPPAHEVRTKPLISGGKHVYPEDAQALGTWISVNSKGVTLVLMNERQPKFPPSHPVLTRGEIILKTTDSPTAREAVRKGSQLNPSQYQPFLLLAIGSEGEYQALFSNGQIFSEQRFPREPHLFISSGYGNREARQAREAQFAKLRAAVSVTDADLDVKLRAMHRSHEPEKGTKSICMHHEKAGSVSLTQVKLALPHIEMGYYPGPPCETPESSRISVMF